MNPETFLSSSSSQFKDLNAISAKRPVSKNATIKNGIDKLNTKMVTSKIYKKISFEKDVENKKKKTQIYKAKTFINTKI